MRLAKFRVQNFRSIKDTGWVSVDDWTCLVGPNEAGKSNILRALHRLNPADNKTYFDLDEDCPNEEWSDASTKDHSEIEFASALFELSAKDRGTLSQIVIDHSETYIEPERACSLIEITRNYANSFKVQLYSTDPETTIHIPFEAVAAVTYSILVPKFCYYDEYATLASEINLPATIRRLADVFDDSSEELVATLEEQILQIFLKQIHPDYKEILQEYDGYDDNERKKHKRRRNTALNALATNLGKRLNKQWRAGKYTFYFDIDGDDLSIRVSDDKRSEKILLSVRGAGMQAFFSLLLLCEHTKTRDTSPQILLFDEPGAHLHPTAQQELGRYFNEFAQQQQLIYTTHSPFMIDHNHIDRVKATYLGEDGYTAISNNLSRPLDKNQAAFLPLYAALDISISETLFLGCDILLVEGVSDQIYLLAIKQRLLRQKTWTRNKELIIIPVKGAPKMIYHVSLLAARGHLPLILLDSDKSGEDSKEALKDRFYENPEDHILQVGDFCQNNKTEIEDLFHRDTIVTAVNQLYKLTDDKSIDANALLASKAIMPQIKKFLYDHGIKDFGQRKVEIAKIVKKMIEEDDDFPVQTAWQKLFAAINIKLDAQNGKASKRSE